MPKSPFTRECILCEATFKPLNASIDESVGDLICPACVQVKPASGDYFLTI